MKKILLINKSLCIGGIETVLISQYKEFTRMGYNVDILLFSYKIDYKIDFDDNLKFVKDNNKDVEIFFHSNHYDVVICHVQSARICSYIKNAIKDVIFVLHGMFSQQLINRSFLAKYFKKLKIKSLYNDQNIVSISQAIHDDIVNIGVKAKKHNVIYNPFNATTIRKKAEQIDNGKVVRRKYIVWVGRLHKIKDLPLLIDIYYHFKNTHNLIIVGDGSIDIKLELNKQIRNLNIEKNVSFIGYTNNPYFYIKHADFSLLTSHSEGFGNTIIESLILGTKVFSVDIPASREILSKDFNFALLKNRDAYECYLNIKKTLDKELKINVDQIAKMYSSETSSLKYINFLN